jgi:hypothetical protein
MSGLTSDLQLFVLAVTSETRRGREAHRQLLFSNPSLVRASPELQPRHLKHQPKRSKCGAVSAMDGSVSVALNPNGGVQAR